MKKFEDIIGLMHGNGPGSASLEQHCAAMQMDRDWSWTYNQLCYTVHDALKAATR